MYLNSGTDYYVVSLEGLEVVCKSKLRIMSPNVKFKLLSYSDLNKIQLMRSSGMKKEDAYEEICNKCIIGIIGFENEEINFDESPAGIVDHIGLKIMHNSSILTQDIEESFASVMSGVSIYERLAMVVARYSGNSYEFCQQLPLDDLLKRYAICHLAFPNDVPPIVFEKEEESAVGG